MGELPITSSNFARPILGIASVIPQGEIEKLLGGCVSMLDEGGSKDASFGHSVFNDDAF
jgi:hypothetical protein